MSLVNLIVQDDRAYVITDSAHYDIHRGGAVTRFGPKSMVLDAQRLVIATAGQLQCAHLAKGIQANQHLSQDALVKEMPSIARDAVEHYRVDLCSVVVFAGYSPERGAFGGVFMTHAFGGPVPEQNYRIFERKALLVPMLPGLPLGPLSRCTAYNPYTTSLGTIELQRRQLHEMPDGSVGCFVAGDIDVVSIGPDGFDIQTIAHYPAEIGEPVPLPPPLTAEMDRALAAAGVELKA